MVDIADTRRASAAREDALAHELAVSSFAPPDVGEVRERLATRWSELACAIAPGGDLDGVGARLLDAWSESHRGYHGIHHLAQVVDDLDGDGASGCAASALTVAAFFHDAVYGPRQGGVDERDSAAWLRAALDPEVARGRLDAAIVAVAEAVVLATARPLDVPVDAPHAAAIRRFLDADFRVFASGPARYEAYVAGVRREFAAVPDDAFRAGRLAFLDRLAATVDARGGLFFEASPLEERTARANLERERASLRERVAGAR
jgi:predicted metal-dependent HD superfamily phosphohydrolase